MKEKDPSLFDSPREFFIANTALTKRAAVLLIVLTLLGSGAVGLIIGLIRVNAPTFANTYWAMQGVSVCIALTYFALFVLLSRHGSEYAAVCLIRGLVNLLPFRMLVSLGVLIYASWSIGSHRRELPSRSHSHSEMVSDSKNVSWSALFLVPLYTLVFLLSGSAMLSLVLSATGVSGTSNLGESIKICILLGSAGIFVVHVIMSFIYLLSGYPSRALGSVLSLVLLVTTFFFSCASLLSY